MLIPYTLQRFGDYSVTDGSQVSSTGETIITTCFLNSRFEKLKIVLNIQINILYSLLYFVDNRKPRRILFDLHFFCKAPEPIRRLRTRIPTLRVVYI